MQLDTAAGDVEIAGLRLVKGLVVERLPYSVRILLENVLRRAGEDTTDEDVRRMAEWPATCGEECSFAPSRILMQDFTGVPAFVELAAARDALAGAGKDPSRINPAIPVDLVIDHSVQVDQAGSADALGINARLDFLRNRERYAFLKWAQSAFANVRIVPPGMGIVHQVNLEYLANVVTVRPHGEKLVAMPDTLVGTDSHTTMINGLGVLGWGVGGIEAEAAMLGQRLSMPIPEVVGFRLDGALPEGATATDLVLTITQMLRKHGVVGRFVEFYGDALRHLSLPDRSTIANMAPEYGATVGYFPIDIQTLAYLRQTGRPKQQIDLVERYARTQGLFHEPHAPYPSYTDALSLDLRTVQPVIAGPRNPSERTPLSAVRSGWQGVLREHRRDEPRQVSVTLEGEEVVLKDGDAVIAAITSCTNTSNPAVMIAAGLLAKKAVEKGLKVPPHVKTSLTPGSRTVSEYLRETGLLGFLEQLNFHVVGYGCATCIGNSGPLHPEIERTIADQHLIVSAVLSGNRNFAGRVHPAVRANYLASPPLVVAYALAGTVNTDLLATPLGHDRSGRAVFLRDVWPSQEEVQKLVDGILQPELFRKHYAEVFEGDESWKSLVVPESILYPWDERNTYIQKPPFFDRLQERTPSIRDILGARALLMLGNGITTDHISPAADIPAESPTGKYLRSLGVRPADFNSYGSRRGNDRAMERGTFANIRLRNELAPSMEGGVTPHWPGAEVMPVFDAADRYKREGVPTLVIAGKEYGTGSSRDWAAKGTLLLGVRAVLAESFERIHRSNLVGMGVIPLEFLSGETRETLGINGKEIFDIIGLTEGIVPGQRVTVRAADPDTGQSKEFFMNVRVDNESEAECCRQGGLLQMLLRRQMG